MKRLVFILCVAAASFATAADFSIVDYGAKTDGSKCTEAFAKAIDACANAGGGRVVVPDGRWFTGAIRFKSNVELHLGDGAEVVFSQDPADYLPAVHTSWEGMECWNYCPLVYAYCCTNVAITGKGVLRAFDGKFEDSFWEAWVPQAKGIRAARRQLYDWGATDYPVEKRQIWKMKNANTRPHFVQFNRCKNVRWEDFKVRNSPFWTLHLYLCDGVVARGLDVKAEGHNNDGIDIEMTRNVLVERCTFDQGDDTFVLKAGRNRDGWRLATPTENVEIRDCHMAHACSYICCGSEISGGIRNVYVHDCTVGKCGYLCYVKTNRRRGAFVEGIRFENIRAKRCKSVVAVATDVLYEWANFPDYELRTTRIGNLSFKDVFCELADCRVDITGDLSLPVDGVRLENVRVGKALIEDRLVAVRNVVEDGKDVKPRDVLSVADAGGDIQKAIDRVAASGGGRVFVPGGDWRTGPVVNKSGVELNLASNARLTFADDPALYRTAEGTYRPLLSAADAERFRISGYGHVTALTAGWKDVPADRRPPLVSFENCRRACIGSVSLRNTPSRMLVAKGCPGLFVNGVEFIAPIAESDFLSVSDCPGLMTGSSSFWIGDGTVEEPVYEKMRHVYLTISAPRRLQGAVWTDTAGFPINAHGGGMLYHGGRYYWYGEHKVYGEAGNRAHVGVHVYSSPNLYDWKDEGVALAVEDDAESLIGDGCVIERPKVVRAKTGKFVMFFHLELKPLISFGKGYFAAYTGIAVADRPEGPFKFVSGRRPNSGEYGVWGHESRDQTLFVDDDGAVWQFFSTDHNRNMRASRLTDDCLGYTGESYQILTGDTTEAPAVFKRNGTYWMIGSGCSGWAPNAARLYRADRISGPWKRLGNPCKGLNLANGLGPEKTWGGQSTFVLPVRGRKDTFVAMFDMWNPQNQIDSRYIWLPVTFTEDSAEVVWQDEFRY